MVWQGETKYSPQLWEKTPVVSSVFLNSTFWFEGVLKYILFLSVYLDLAY